MRIHRESYTDAPPTTRPVPWGPCDAVKRSLLSMPLPPTRPRIIPCRCVALASS